MAKKKSSGGLATTKGGKRRKPGSTFTTVNKRGPNKGDTIKKKVAKGGKEFPVKVVKDRGGKNTLAINKKKKKKKR